MSWRNQLKCNGCRRQPARSRPCRNVLFADIPARSGYADGFVAFSIDGLIYGSCLAMNLRRFHFCAILLLFWSECMAADKTEYWFVSKKLGDWDTPSFLSLAYTRTDGFVCGTIYSSAMGTNRLDGSLLLGRVTPGGIEVEYASSYYSDQDEIGRALLLPSGKHLVWEPLDRKLSKSWFWGKTTVNRAIKPYARLGSAELRQCELARAKKHAGALSARDLYVEP